MSFRKAEQLPALATLTAAQHTGSTLEGQCPDVIAGADGEGRKRWRLPSAALLRRTQVILEEVSKPM
jgi:hypothetical protein